MLLEKIKENLISAKKARDSESSMLWSTVLSRVKAIEKAEVSKELTDDNVVAVLKKIIKETEEVRYTAEKAGRVDIQKSAEKEISKIQNIIPESMQDVSSEMLEKEIAEILKSIPEDKKKKPMGVVMPALKKKFGNRFDGKEANKIIMSLVNK